MDSYLDIRAYLESFIPPAHLRFPKERGLARMKELLRLLDNPHLAYPTVHVAGTSGKGSTATLIAHLLTHAGYKTGLTISPHLQVINERIQVNGQMISVEKLSSMVGSIEPVIAKLTESELGKPTYFEILLALAFMHFAKEKVDIAVVEAGLGGSWDGTNVVAPLVGVLTNVGLDHTEILGPTVEDIAKDKAGIIKPGMTVVSGVEQESVQNILIANCKLTNCELKLLGRDFQVDIHQVKDYGSTFDFKMGERAFSNLSLALVGKHQVTNAAVALAVVFTLSKQGFSVSDAQVRSALTTAKFPGRLEVIQIYPRVLLDGAHNPDKIKVLLESLSLFPTWRSRWIGVVAFKKDKPVKEMLELLLPHMRLLIATEFSQVTDVGGGLTVPAKEIYAIACSIRSRKVKGRGKTFPIPNPQEGLKAAEEAAGSTGAIVVTGSLYLVGEIRERWHPMEELLHVAR